MLISIIIPTYNEERTIAESLGTLRSLYGEYEIVVVDGGSTDRTAEIARTTGVIIHQAPQGRGGQMNVGAKLAHGEVFLFLHADTRLPDKALQLIQTALRNPAICGGNFRLRFSGHTPGARTLTCLYPLLRTLGLVYGDSAIFVRRSAFETIGGFREIPLFEDCDLYQRLKKTGKFVCLTEYATTSARRFEGHFLSTFALWSLLQILYWLGVNPQRLAQVYKTAR